MTNITNNKFSSFKIPDNIPRGIFRKNDIRGNVETELTKEVVYAVGLAMGAELKTNNLHEIIVACDSRVTSAGLKRALIKGLMETGCQVIDIGSVPSPLLYFATHVLSASSGIMVTGSHNPLSDNGMKIMLNHHLLNEDQLLNLYHRIENKNFIHGQGKLENVDIIPRYYAYVLNDIKLKRPLRVAIDCGNSIVGKVMPDLLISLGCELVELYCDIDGDYPHHFPDPSIPSNLDDLIKTVQENHADIGFAFDGDGDRLGVVTNQGNIIWPDRQLMLFAEHVLKQFPERTVIYDIKCSRLLDDWIRQCHGHPLMWKTGHSFIKAKLIETNAILAAEMSGHIYFHDRWFGFDDALYAAARMLEIISQDKRTVDEIFLSLPNSVNTPEIRVKMPDEKKFQFVDAFAKLTNFSDGKVTTLDGVRVDFSDGFGLVRASNTTPCLVLRFEADSEEHLKRIQMRFKEALLKLDPQLDLTF